MNAKAKVFIDGIKNAETSYLCSSGNILMRYRSEKQKIVSMASKFKDEKAFIAEHLPETKRAALDALARAEETFRKELVRNVSGLKAELKASVSTAVPQEFSQRIQFYRTANIKPSKTETEALLEIGGRNPVVVKAVAKLLDDTGADIKVEARSIEEFENDLNNMDDLTEMPLISAPLEVHTELVDVLRGTPKATRTAAGWREIGEKWNDSVQVLLQNTAVSSRIKSLESVADAWV